MKKGQMSPKETTQRKAAWGRVDGQLCEKETDGGLDLQSNRATASHCIMIHCTINKSMGNTADGNISLTLAHSENLI